MTKKKCFSAVFAKINQIKFIVYVPEGEEWIVAEIRRNKKRLPAPEILRKDLDFVDVLMALFILWLESNYRNKHPNQPILELYRIRRRIDEENAVVCEMWISYLIKGRKSVLQQAHENKTTNAVQAKPPNKVTKKAYMKDPSSRENGSEEIIGSNLIESVRVSQVIQKRTWRKENAIYCRSRSRPDH